MDEKTYHSVSGLVFLLIALLHLARVIYGFEAVIGGYTVPLGFSWIILVIAGYLSYSGLHHSRRH